jgi:hypothetical protein
MRKLLVILLTTLTFGATAQDGTFSETVNYVQKTFKPKTAFQCLTTNSRGDVTNYDCEAEFLTINPTKVILMGTLTNKVKGVSTTITEFSLIDLKPENGGYTVERRCDSDSRMGYSYRRMGNCITIKASSNIFKVRKDGNVTQWSSMDIQVSDEAYAQAFLEAFNNLVMTADY